MHYTGKNLQQINFDNISNSSKIMSGSDILALKLTTILTDEKLSRPRASDLLSFSFENKDKKINLTCVTNISIPQLLKNGTLALNNANKNLVA